MFFIVVQNNSVSAYLCNLVNLVVKKEILNHKGCMEGSLVVFVRVQKKKKWHLPIYLPIHRKIVELKIAVFVKK